MKTKVNIDQEKAIDFILGRLYRSEFVVEEGYNRHPEYINFYEWLHKKKLINKENLDAIQEEIRKEEEERYHTDFLAKDYEHDIRD